MEECNEFYISSGGRTRAPRPIGRGIGPLAARGGLVYITHCLCPYSTLSHDWEIVASAIMSSSLAVAKLRQLLADESKIIVCPGVYDGFTARIALQEGFDALYMVLPALAPTRPSYHVCLLTCHFLYRLEQAPLPLDLDSQT